MKIEIWQIDENWIKANGKGTAKRLEVTENEDLVDACEAAKEKYPGQFLRVCGGGHSIEMKPDADNFEQLREILKGCKE